MSKLDHNLTSWNLHRLAPYLQLKTLVLLLVIWGVLVLGSWFIQRYFLIGAYRNYRKLVRSLIFTLWIYFNKHLLIFKQPPGPPSSILTGTPDYQRGKTHIYFKKLSETYGDIFSVWDGPQLQIVLNSPRIIQELNGKVLPSPLCFSGTPSSN